MSPFGLLTSKYFLFLLWLLLPFTCARFSFISLLPFPLILKVDQISQCSLYVSIFPAWPPTSLQSPNLISGHRWKTCWFRQTSPSPAEMATTFPFQQTWWSRDLLSHFPSRNLFSKPLFLYRPWSLWGSDRPHVCALKTSKERDSTRCPWPRLSSTGAWADRSPEANGSL